jgi:hypothetical protein
MNFTELTTWANNLVTLLQIVGGAMIAVCVAILAITLITSFGNEQRIAFVRVAAATLVIGMFILIGAPRIAALLQSLVSFMNPKP